MATVGAMQRSQISNCTLVQATVSHPTRRISGELASFAAEAIPANVPTNPSASDGPLPAQSEWPTADELESAIRDSDPFELAGGSCSLTGEISELFGEMEPRLPHDTLPSPPPSFDEPQRLELPSSRREP